MLVDFNIPFMTSGIPPRSKNNRIIMGSTPRRYDIREFGPDEMTASFVLESDPDLSGGSVDYVETAGQFYTKSLTGFTDGRTDLPKFTGHGSTCGIFQSSIRMMADLVDAMTHGEKDDLPYWVYRILSDHRNVESAIYPPAVSGHLRSSGVALPTMDMDDFEDVHVAEYVALFEKGLDRLAVVDGVLMRRELEPVISVHIDGREIVIDIVRRQHDAPLVGYGGNELAQIPVAFFRLDEIDAARECARSLLGGRYQRIVERNGFLLSDDRNLCFDGVAATLHAVAVRMNNTLIGNLAGSTVSRSFLSMLTPDVMACHQAFERYLPLCDGTDIPGELEDAVMAVSNLPKEQRDLFVDLQHEMIISMAIDRWEQRPIVARPAYAVPTL